MASLRIVDTYVPGDRSQFDGRHSPLRWQAIEGTILVERASTKGELFAQLALRSLRTGGTIWIAMCEKYRGRRSAWIVFGGADVSCLRVPLSILERLEREGEIECVEEGPDLHWILTRKKG